MNNVIPGFEVLRPQPNLRECQLLSGRTSECHKLKKYFNRLGLTDRCRCKSCSSWYWLASIRVSYQQQPAIGVLSMKLIVELRKCETYITLSLAFFVNCYLWQEVCNHRWNIPHADFLYKVSFVEHDDLYVNQLLHTTIHWSPRLVYFVLI